MKNTLYLNWKSNPSQGEVFTPIELVRDMLDGFPTKIWTNPTTTFIDPCMGKGVFLIETVRRLVDIYGYSEEDAKSRVFGCDNRVKYVNYLKRRGYKNVFHKDSLVEKFNMEFDVVLGNPPYQKQVGPNKTEAIWPKFVQKAFEICKEGGYVSLIHPSSWRNIEGKYTSTRDFFKSKNIIYIKMYNEEESKLIFNVQSLFDWYFCQNIQNEGMTQVCGFDKKISYIDTRKMDFIPNGDFDTIKSLMAKKDESTMEVVFNSSYHTQRNFMSKNYGGDFVYPCVNNVKKDGSLTLFYSNNNNNGDFGVTKLICGKASSGTNFYIDELGEYGVTQYGFYIIDTLDNLIKIKKVLESQNFIKLSESFPRFSKALNNKILATFRKDFWKEFLDEDGNIIEPNFNQNVEQL